MKRLVLAVIAVTVLASPVALADDSYLYAHGRKAITNGEPVNVKALKARFSGSDSYF